MATLPPSPFINSVSPGACLSSLPSGESDPSVTLDSAPGENRFVLDVAAFMGAIDGAPAFLANPTPEYLAILQVLADIEPIRAAIARH